MWVNQISHWICNNAFARLSSIFFTWYAAVADSLNYVEYIQCSMWFVWYLSFHWQMISLEHIKAHAVCKSSTWALENESGVMAHLSKGKKSIDSNSRTFFCKEIIYFMRLLMLVNLLFYVTFMRDRIHNASFILNDACVLHSGSLNTFHQTI